jgi:hypothetical protein
MNSSIRWARPHHRTRGGRGYGFSHHRRSQGGGYYLPTPLSLVAACAPRLMTSSSLLRASADPGESERIDSSGDESLEPRQLVCL